MVSMLAVSDIAHSGRRNTWQLPRSVVHELHLEPGMGVADLGSAAGYFTFRLARAVGPTGTVFAVDTNQALMDELFASRRHRGVQNIQTVLAQADDPLLEDDTVDLVFVCNTYHHLSDRVRYFAALRPALHDGGRVVIVEFNGSSLYRRLFSEHWSDPQVIETEMMEAGYLLRRSLDFLPRQSFLEFELADRPNGRD